MTARPVGRSGRPPVWRDIRVLRLVAQIGAVLLTAGLVAWLWSNLRTNLRAQGIETGFDFLGQPTGVQITDSDFSPASPIRAMLLAGIQNTLVLVAVGLPLVTLLGTLVGIGRLSTNWLVAKAAGLYVETLRNVPPLLVIIYASQALLLPLPPLDEGLTPLDLFVVSNRYISVTGFTARSGAAAYLTLLGLGIVAAVVVWVWRTRRFDRTGEPHHRVWWSSGLVLLVAVGGYLALGGPILFSPPILEGRRVVGGFSANAGYMAMLIGLVLYTASHVAEIVRGSILAVPRGQSEAANALALSGFQRLRYVILPQAFRIAIPPIISQYLNFTKNTSLGLAVGYAEITLLVFQAIGNAQPAPQLILMLMGVYLVFSLTISALVNMVNRRLQVVR